MSRTVSEEIYTFDELDEKAKETAIENFRNKADYPHDDWHTELINEMKKELEEKGYPDSKIAYTGFWSQGDGASFTCPQVDIEKWLEGRKDKYKEAGRTLRLIKDGLS